MKHLILQDDEMTFMVYYQPRKKEQMFDLIFKSQQTYWKEQEETHLSLLPYLILDLQANGFKCVEITSEMKNAINVYDLSPTTMTYKGIEIFESQYGFSFYLGSQFNSCLSIGEATSEIDRYVAYGKRN